MTKHTPTPWRKAIVQFEKSEWAMLWTKNQICIAKGMDITAIVYGPDDQEEANAAYIVRAVNAYDSYKRFKDFVLEYFPGVKDNPFIQGELDAISKSEVK